MKSPRLIPHYRYQIESIRSAEHQLLEVIEGLKRFTHASGFSAAIADLENCCRERRDWLCSVPVPSQVGNGPSLSGRAGSAFLEDAMFEIVRSDTARAQTLALCLCAALDRQLINGYRIARELAANLGLCSHVRRLDALMAALGDRNVCWKALPGSPEIEQTAFISG